MWSPALLTVLFASSAFGAIFQRTTDLPRRQYDFIIVGGGTAGLVVANRLTENPKFSVLVIEAGASNEDFPLSKIPFYGKLINSAADWNFTTAPMKGLGGRSLGYPQGHVLGGTSTLNGLAYTRGSAEDYDRYARITGDDGWSWAKLQPYFRKNERWTAPADHRNTTGQFNPAVHGFGGINAVSLPGYIFPVDSRVIQATRDEFPFNRDMNSGYQLGIGWTQSTIKDGVRSSSATSYLAPQYAQRPNLCVLLNTRVTRVLPSTPHATGRPLSFRTAEFISEADVAAALQGGKDLTKIKTHTITATKELILSSGVINTPHILQHSGIGDPGILAPLGITPLVTLPDVGKNLTDHVFVANTWRVRDGAAAQTFEDELRNATLASELLKEWEEGGGGVKGRGPLGAGTFNQAGWFRVASKDEGSVFKGMEDPAAGRKTPHFEFIIANGKTRPPIPATGNFMVVGTVVLAPLSRGFVHPTSRSPLHPPVINPNLLASPVDFSVMRAAIRHARRFVSGGFKDWVVALVDTAQTDAELDQWIRATGVTVSHCVGTAAMSARGSRWGVVDPDLKVKGVKGMRVVDASVLPLVPAAHTQAATYVVAERAADLIKAAWV